MCGIVGYISKGDAKNSIQTGINALKRLEYRGYDSSGLAFWDQNKKDIFFEKSLGKIVSLENKIDSNKNTLANPLILHTRWATTGAVTINNTHPHTDCQKNIWLVHNGIIENYQSLKENLKKEGHRFYSDTDTEVLAHLIEKFFNGNLEEATKKALKLVKGTYGLAIIARDDPQKIVAARFSSPLLLGLGEDAYIVASDPSAVITHTKKVIYLGDKNIAVVKPDQFSIEDLDSNKVEGIVNEIDWNIEEAQKGGHDHFMLKEILEQPESIRNTLRGKLVLESGSAKLGGIENKEEALRQIDRLNIIACGTSYYAALVGKYMLEEYAGIPTEVDLASEFRYRKPIIGKNTASIFISQSGETADTLAALKEVKAKGGLSLGIVNVVGSSIAREVDIGIYNHIGPEIGVASTKAFTSQLTILSLLALYLGRQRQLSLVLGQRIVRELTALPELIKETLATKDKAKKLAKKYKNAKDFLYLGRKYNYPVALEGALKLKEISYIHAEGYSAGEMKHGPISMIDKNFPTMAICTKDSVYEKMVSNIEEIKARKGPIIVVATKGDRDVKKLTDDIMYIPKTLEMLTPIISIIPLQLFAYYVGVLRGCDVDKPRNLAKSVTVE